MAFSRRLALGICVALLTWAVSSGCKSKKVLAPDTAPSSREAALDLLLHPPSIQSYSAKIKTKIVSTLGTDKATLYLRAETDSILWVAAKRLSVEGGRMQVDEHTATFINRLDKSYQIFPLDTIQTLFGFKGEYDYLQAMMYGVPPTMDMEGVTIDKTEDHWIVKKVLHDLPHEFHVSRETGQFTGGKFTSKLAGSGEWTYADYREVKEGISLPHKRTYEMILPDDSYLSIDMEFVDLVVNEPVTIRFEVPEHYTRIE